MNIDPDSTLRQIRALAAAVLAGTAGDTDAERLADLVEALDEWLHDGQCLPVRWACATYAP